MKRTFARMSHSVIAAEEDTLSLAPALVVLHLLIDCAGAYVSSCFNWPCLLIGRRRNYASGLPECCSPGFCDMAMLRICSVATSLSGLAVWLKVSVALHQRANARGLGIDFRALLWSSNSEQSGETSTLARKKAKRDRNFRGCDGQVRGNAMAKMRFSGSDARR